MPLRPPAGFISAFYNPLQVPNAPTSVSASAGDTQATVSFTAPTNVGGGAITGYGASAVKTSDGTTLTNTGASSPITVTGLTNDAAYTMNVWALNSYGPSPFGTSGSVTPVVQGQQAYTTAGTYTWVAPTGVTSVSVVAVGGGAGAGPGGFAGGGGELRYKNNISVTPGNSYTVVVGAGGVGNKVDNTGRNGGSSTFNSTTVVANGATNETGGSGGTGDGGGNGGQGTNKGGGGAGGYSGAGGASASAGAGGGGGGGGNAAGGQGGGGGGGVGILGSGSNGTAGSGQNGGGGGSGGSTGSAGSGNSGGAGGAYGGGGGGEGGGTNGNGSVGAVRIIWPGTTRSFPSTQTGDL